MQRAERLFSAELEHWEDALALDFAALASEVNAPDVIDQVPGAPPAMPKGGLDAQTVSAVIGTRCWPLVCPISMPRSTHLDLLT